MSEKKKTEGKPMLLDRDADSADPNLPAFLARPEGAPVYHGFPIVDETLTDGWRYGAISDYVNPKGCTEGDGFVVAPDGSRAGLVWSVGEFPTETVCEPSEGRWGVYELAFPRPVRNLEDLVACFREVLPEIKRIYLEVKGNAG